MLDIYGRQVGKKGWTFMVGRWGRKVGHLG